MNVDASVWVSSLTALAIISALSLSGALALVLRQNAVQAGLVPLISFAAGTLLGDAFIHLLPEVAESPGGLGVGASAALLGGVIAFFVLEKVLHWHHAHIPHEEVVHPVAVANLVGDGLHNFVDGAIVAGSFLVSPKVGLATAIAVAIHEIPQELGDFGILVHAGVKPRRAVLLNFTTGLAAIAGGVLTLTLAGNIVIDRFLTPFTAGAFVYIASTDLIPELHKEPELKRSFVQLAALLGGVGVMFLLLLFE